MRGEKPFVIHPFLFGIYSILYLHAHNIRYYYEYEFSFSVTLLPIVIVLGATFLLLLLLKLIFKDYNRAGILALMILLFFFSYGYIWYAARGLTIAGFTIGRHRYLMSIWVILFIIGFLGVVKKNSDFRSITNYLNVVTTSLILISFINIATYKIKTINVLRENTNTESREAALDFKETDALPDIYYIILDEYARADILKDVYNYDNNKFIDSLENKGFYVAHSSRSNYAITYLSLASSLNMEYINYLSERVGIESKDMTVPYEMIQNNKVWRFLKSKGYRYIHFSSGWGPTFRNKNADINIGTVLGWPWDTTEFTKFTLIMLNTTILRGPLEKYYRPAWHRKSIIYSFEKLGEIPSIKEPTFVFVHLITPHSPYIFDRNGNPVPQVFINTGDAWKLKQQYIDQLIFVTKKIENLIDKILSESDVRPIIVIQADTGPQRSAALTETVQPTKAWLGERMSIFNAYYMPKDGECPLYKSISPVNSFRLIFDSYFDTNYGLLEDKSYFSTYGDPYFFITYSDEVKQSKH